MAKRVKKYYAYWELPDWEDAEVLVTRIFKHPNNEMKTMVSLRKGDSIYIIKLPKRNEWQKVRQGHKVRLTKIFTQPKNAYLKIHE